MKIVVISNLYPPYVRGGAEVITARMVHGLRDRGHDISVLTTQPFSAWGSLRIHGSMEEGIVVHRFFPMNVYHYLDAAKKNIFLRIVWHCINVFQIHSAIITRSFLLREKPDMVITHNLMGMGMNLPRVISSLRIPHMHVAHDVQLVNPSGIIECGNEGSMCQKVLLVIGYRALMRFYFSRVSVIISPSQFLMDFYLRNGFFSSAKRYTLPNPIPLSASSGTHSCHIPLSILFVGQITKTKGIFDLIQAVKESPKKSVILHIAGTGTESDTISNMCHGDTRFVIHGYVPHDELRKIFHSADLLVIPSRCYDNSPTVLFEALSFGVPAVVSDCGGAKEIIREGENGWVYKAGSISSLVSRLSELIANPALIERASKNAQPSIASFSTEHYFERLEEILNHEIHRSDHGQSASS